MLQYRPKKSKTELALAVARIATEEINTDDGESSMASKIFGSDVEGDSNEDEVAITNVEAPPTVEPDPSARKKY